MGKEREKGRYRDAKGILGIVRDGLCHRCGACIGLCPSGTLEADPSGYPVEVGKCTACNKCVKVCSGAAVDYQTLGERLFGEGYRYGSALGEMRGAYVGCSLDEEIRWRGASGGAVTGLLVHLLESGKIKGAVVCVPDPADPAMAKGAVARTRADIIAAAGSRYTTSPTLAVLQDLKKEEGPFAVVCVPCQAHALRRAFALDRKLARKVSLLVGLFCHVKIDHIASRELGEMGAPGSEPVKEVRYRQKDEEGWPGNTVEIEYGDGKKWRSPMGPAETVNILCKAYPLGRCLTCLDMTAEFADLAVGDPWIRDSEGRWKYEEREGLSSIIVRTPAGEEALFSSRDADTMRLEEIPAGGIFDGQRMVMNEKKVRIPVRLRVMKFFGRPIPAYPMPLPRGSAAAFLLEGVYLFSRVGTLVGPVRRILLKVAFSPFGQEVMRLRGEQKKRKMVRRVRKRG